MVTSNPAVFFFCIFKQREIQNPEQFELIFFSQPKAAAHLDKGLLRVTVPRLAAPEKQPKSIPIGGK